MAGGAETVLDVRSSCMVALVRGAAGESGESGESDGARSRGRRP